MHSKKIPNATDEELEQVLRDRKALQEVRDAREAGEKSQQSKASLKGPTAVKSSGAPRPKFGLPLTQCGQPFDPAAMPEKKSTIIGLWEKRK